MGVFSFIFFALLNEKYPTRKRLSDNFPTAQYFGVGEQWLLRSSLIGRYTNWHIHSFIQWPLLCHDATDSSSLQPRMFEVFGRTGPPPIYGKAPFWNLNIL